MIDFFQGKRPFPYDEGYSGPAKQVRYFEGWYQRQVTADKSRSLAVILGLSLSPDPHAFIQILAGPESRVLKIRYELEDLRARRDRYEVTLGPNRFSASGFELDIEHEGNRIAGRVEFDNRAVYPVNFFSPSIMGPFAWVPGMECIHGVVSMDHGVRGSVRWNDEAIDFTGGRGYIEKDRGRSMPKQWIWVHTNQFETAGDSLMISVARIPWMGFSFTGHLGFLRFDERLYRIGTYAGTHLTGRVEENGLELCFSRRRFELDVEMEWEGRGGPLDAPVKGSMSREILEAPSSRIRASLRDSGTLLWEGEASPAAVEVVGDAAALFKSCAKKPGDGNPR